jgi:DNA-binding beta-propeller fold protein YncE
MGWGPGPMSAGCTHLLPESTRWQSSTCNLLEPLLGWGPVEYPDGLAYAPAVERVFVSDERGAVDAVIDAKSNTLIKNVPLGGGAGNTVFDAGSGNILVAVHKKNELVSVDPSSMQIVKRLALPGGENPHGIAIDAVNHLA